MYYSFLRTVAGFDLAAKSVIIPVVIIPILSTITGPSKVSVKLIVARYKSSLRTTSVKNNTVAGTAIIEAVSNKKKNPLPRR